MSKATVEAPKVRELVISRVFDATPDQVFEAWTNPEILPKWWGPRGMTTPVCEIDARPGGIFRTVMRAPDGSEYPTSGIFLEVSRPTRLVFTDAYDVDFAPRAESFLTAVSTFEDLGDGKTRFTARAKHKSDEDLAKHEAMGFVKGWGETLDRLAETLAEMGPAKAKGPIPVVEDAKAEFRRATNRIAKGLETTPDDRINWSPGPTARTPLQVAAHAALSIEGIRRMFTGNPADFSDTDRIDAFFRSEEAKYPTREEVMALLEKNGDAYIAYLDSLTPADVAGTWNGPMGEFPMAAAITFCADHLRGHGAQLDYIQTAYGDRVWHY